MEIKLRQAYSFHQLGQRENQEDSRFPDADLPSVNQRFFIVCDGVGGSEKGEVASKTVCSAFGKFLKNIDFTEDFPNEKFSHALYAAYDALDAKANSSNKDMGTTLTFVCFHGKGCTMAHIGDSRIYQIRPSEGIIYRSEDHSMVNSLVHTGTLTPEQAIDHPQGNVITRYMEPTERTGDRCLATVMRTTDIEPGDYFFLCSDGVLHNVSDDDLFDILSSDLSDEEKMRQIAERSKNSEDNNTAYLIPVENVEADVHENIPEIEDENSHATKKIKMATQSMEEIESAKPLSKRTFSNWLKDMLKLKWRMKKVLLLMALLVVSATAAYSSQPLKKKVNNTVADSIAVVFEKAKAGDAEAQNLVGTWYYSGGDSIKQDYKQALQWWARAAKQEHLGAIGNMAMCYQLGQGGEKDTVMAMKLYETAIKKGNKEVIPMHEALAKNDKNVFSCLLMRDCCLKGIGVNKDPKQALLYQELAAESGDVRSQFALGLGCLNRNQADKAAKWFKMAKEQGNAGATYYYGYLLLNGMGVPQDKDKGIECLKQAVEMGFPMAYYQLGAIYQEGNGVDKDLPKAFEYIKNAAYLGNANAKWALANMYMKGEGTDVDYYLAVQWMAEVAQANHIRQINELLKDDSEGAFSQYLMGLRMYFVEKNYDSAILHFKNVEKAKIPEGMTMQGLCYANKDYQKQNLKKALKMLGKAASESHVANYYLSLMYESRTGVIKDEERAMELLTKAAEAGVAPAECKLGDCYMTGTCVPKDQAKAALLYLDAEAQGHLAPQSAKYLAECYKNKLSVLPDLDNAEKRTVQLNNYKAHSTLSNFLEQLENSTESLTK